jgi:hypothetical protein
MTIVKCQVDGCTQEFRCSESVSEKVTFLCRYHAPQMSADLAPKFQDGQFDDFHFPRLVSVLYDEKNKETEFDTLNPTKRHIDAAPGVK